MSTLVLYVDKWAIFGAVCTARDVVPVKTEAKEDRIWLYFYEDNNNKISFGKAYRESYRHKMAHYHGDVFSQMVSAETHYYQRFGQQKELRYIFGDAGVWDLLHKAAGGSNGMVDVYLSFSKDVQPLARQYFREELEKNSFRLPETTAPIGHLALEHLAKGYRHEKPQQGYYLVVNALNENLHYALYRRNEQFFVLVDEDKDGLRGFGVDLRKRALSEEVVQKVNRHVRLSPEECEEEYLRIEDEYCEQWLKQLRDAPSENLPVNFEVTLRDHYRPYKVPVKPKTIEERTKARVIDIVRAISDFVQRNLKNETLQGIVFLGDMFDKNEAYKDEVQKELNVPNDRIKVFRSSDIFQVLGVYPHIDTSQFSELAKTEANDTEDERLRVKQAQEERRKQEQAEKEAKERSARRKEAEERERRLKEAIEAGLKSEREKDYDKMAECFRMALEISPDDEEAKQKYNEALLRQAEEKNKMDFYRRAFKAAEDARDKKDWETAKRRAEEALNYLPESKDAKTLLAKAEERKQTQQALQQHLNRCDMFVAQKAYDQALAELKNARKLRIDSEEKQQIAQREQTINTEQGAAANRISALTAAIGAAVERKDYDKAIENCMALIQADAANATRWNSRLQELMQEKLQYKETNKQLEELRKKITLAQWSNKWSEMVKLCEQALSLREDATLRDLLGEAKKLLEQQTPTPPPLPPTPPPAPKSKGSNGGKAAFFSTEEMKKFFEDVSQPTTTDAPSDKSTKTKGKKANISKKDEDFFNEGTSSKKSSKKDGAKGKKGSSVEDFNF